MDWQLDGGSGSCSIDLVLTGKPDLSGNLPGVAGTLPGTLWDHNAESKYRVFRGRTADPPLRLPPRLEVANSCVGAPRARKPPEDHQKTAGNGHPSPESALLSDRILSLLRRDPSASRRKIAATLGTTRSTIRYRLDRLREAGKIERIGPDRGGHWRVLGESANEPDQ